MLDGERGLGVWQEGENYEVWYLLGCGPAGRGGICLLLGGGSPVSQRCRQCNLQAEKRRGCSYTREHLWLSNLKLSACRYQMLRPPP